MTLVSDDDDVLIRCLFEMLMLFVLPSSEGLLWKEVLEDGKLWPTGCRVACQPISRRGGEGGTGYTESETQVGVASPGV